MDSTWGNFQSLIQFAAAASLAVFTLLPMRDHFISEDERNLNRTIEDFKKHRKHEVHKARNIERRFRGALKEDKTVFSLLNIASIPVFFVDFILLIASSFWADEPISAFMIGVIILSNTPLLVAVIYIVVKMSSYEKLRKERRDLDKED